MGLIADLAGKKYRLTYDPAAEFEARRRTATDAGNRWLPDPMYEIIPCQFGEIYQYDEGILSWLCKPRGEGRQQTLAGTVKREHPEWKIQLEAEDGMVFLVPVEQFETLIQYARPYRKMTEETRQKHRERALKVRPWEKRGQK